MSILEIQLHDKPTHQLTVSLSKKQLEVLQDALDFSANQFADCGSDPQSSIDLLRKLHDAIKDKFETD